jgi:hypothetical protein
MQPKSFLASKTIWGIVLAIAPQIVELAATGVLGPKAQAIISGLGALLAIYGRAKAERPITIVPGAPCLLPLCAICALCGALALQPGCATSSSSPNTELIAQAAVVYATSKVVENNPDYAPRIAAIAGEIRKTASGDGVDTVAAVIAIARARIDWSKLSPADTALVNLLLDAVSAELTARLGAGVLPPDKALVVAKVAGWIEKAAIAYAPATQPLG